MDRTTSRVVHCDDEPYESCDNLDFDSDSLDNFDTDSESEQYEDIVPQDRDVINAPLPAPPPEETNGIVRLARNFRKIKTMSKEFGKSLRQFSQRKNNYADAALKVPEQVPEENSTSVTQMEEKQKNCDPQQPFENLFSRLRRSMSLAPDKALDLTSKLGRHSRSTFYISEPFEADQPHEDAENKTKRHTVSADLKSKLSRPKVPPPPVPETRGIDTNPVQLRHKPALSIQSKINSLYNESGLFNISAFSTNHNNNQISNKNRTKWYSETGLYSKSFNSSASSTKSFGKFTYNNVIDELSQKIGEPRKNRPSTVTYTNEYAKSDVTKDNDRENGNDSGTYGSDYNYYNGNSVYSFNSTDSKKDDSSLTYALSEIKFLEDEPLYQFYDEIISKNLQSLYNSSISSDDHSDHYEELIILKTDSNSIGAAPAQSARRTPPPRPPPPDLRNGITRQSSIPLTRSLWCDVPEVANSAVLSQLSTQQKKLQEAKFEILTSEYSYLNSLNVLQEHFVEKIEKSNIVNEQELDILFGKIRQVRHCSKRILYDLEKCWKTNILLDGICEIVQKHAEGNFDVYISYCENQVMIGDTLNEIKQREDFRNLLVKLESSSSCKYLSLYSFLMLPMQRITRWPLLVEAILKRLDENDPEYDICEFALSSLHKVANQCNEAARKKEREIELIKIVTKLEFPKTVPYIELRSPHRWLLRSGTVIWLQPRTDDSKMTIRRRLIKTPLELFMFNDLFLVCKKKSEECFTVLQYCQRSLIEVRLPDQAPEILRKEVQDKYALNVAILENHEGHLVEMFLTCQTETERERWIDVLSPPRSDNPDEIVYESWDCPQVVAIFNYTAQQPDEFSLTTGDEINVLRKMNDGWYYGERLRDHQTGWFPSNYIKEIPNHHVRAKNIKERYRILQFTGDYLKAS